MRHKLDLLGPGILPILSTLSAGSAREPDHLAKVAL
jgi:hypothetical protein